MRRSVVLTALAVGMVVWPATVSNPIAAVHTETGWLTGQVVVFSDDIRHATVVTVDLDTGSAVADGLIDQAFRVQDPSRLVEYHGMAAVEYGRGYVVIRPLEDRAEGFGFTVSATDAVGAGETTLHAAAGLSRFWGEAVAQSVAEVQARLLVPRRTGGERIESFVGCDSCDVGGPGSSQCELPDAPMRCEAECRDGYYACCNYPGECGCCLNIEQRPLRCAARTRPFEHPSPAELR